MVALAWPLWQRRVAEKIGCIPALVAVFAVVTGMVGALSGKYLFDALGIGTDATGWMARALQVNADADVWAALALGCRWSSVASLLIPLVAREL